jgi:hypothetical protein
MSQGLIDGLKKQIADGKAIARGRRLDRCYCAGGGGFPGMVS